jgi:hypothetical protein
MRRDYSVLALLIEITCLLFAVPLIAAQDNPSTGPAVNLVVTLEARHGSNVPDIGREDVMVYEGRERDKVTGWLPLQGDHAGLELFVMLDDSSNTSLGSQLEDIRQFISTQPATTKIGVAYMQNGIAQVVQNLTSDHALASKALRLPLGSPGANASPYFSLGDLIKRWPEAAERREVLMITDGIDRYGGTGPDNPYVDSAIEQAQRAGGEAYYLANGAPVSFAPYLEDLTHRLGRQYLVTFLAKAEKKAGMQRIKLMTEVPNAELVSADRVYVPATPQ